VTEDSEDRALVEVGEIVNAIAQTSSRNAKLYLLKKNEKCVGLKPILKFIFNPYTHTGISSNKLEKICEMSREAIKTSHSGISWKEALVYFNMHTTGSDADLQMAVLFLTKSVFLPGATRNTVKLAKAILTNNMQIGITATSLNTAYGDEFIPKTGCMLGTLHQKAPKAPWPRIITEKLDGIRRILIKDCGMVSMYSRSGHKDEGLVDIEQEATKYLPDNFMYDGELIAVGDYADNIAVRQASASLANSKGIRHGIALNVFDMVPLDEYWAGCSKDNAFTRKIRLAATFGDAGLQYLCPKDWYSRIIVFGLFESLHFIKPVPILGVAQSFADVEPIVKDIWDRNGEGVMLNTIGGLYEIKRSKELLKVKLTEEYILECVGFEEGEGRNSGRLGSLITYYKGNRLGVSGRIPDDQRIYIWKHQDEFMNHKFEIDSFGESTNALGIHSLNCPIFKRWVGDEE
jgi:DNA ligase 1